MSEKKHGRVENAVQSMAEAADHPLRQAREAFGLGDAERWTVHQVQFSETARVAARRALWYLRLAEIDWDESHCRHVQNMAFGQLDPIHVPAAPDELCQPGDPDSKCEYRGAIEPQFTELTRSWNELLSTLGSPH